MIVVDLNLSEEAASKLWQAGICVVTAGFSTLSFPAVVVDDYDVGFVATQRTSGPASVVRAADPGQRSSATQIRYSPSCTPTEMLVSVRSSCRGIPTQPKPICSRSMSFQTWNMARCSQTRPLLRHER